MHAAKLNDIWGKPDPIKRSSLARQIGGDEYQQFVRPILNNRCAVCHGCYDAPCQLKLTSYEGLERGASPDVVYDGTRLLAASPTRLFTDGENTLDWRTKNFHPVLNERSQTPQANLQGSVLQLLLELKSKNPLPTANAPLKGFDFSLNREQECPTIENFESYSQKHPSWGMPYGLPGLTKAELKTIANWIAKGAPYSEPSSLSPKIQKEITSWEHFLNGQSLKERLMSRYIFEHLFLANLYFENNRGDDFFNIVRSKTAPGKPIKKIKTRRPYDDPGVTQVYYRLERVKPAIALKRHLPYELSSKRMSRYKELFLELSYDVSIFPSYEPQDASNPFLTFRQIPIDSRYRFLLDEAQFTIMNFIKGPVCRGQIALNVIRDNFWVVFIEPDLKVLNQAHKLLTNWNVHNQSLPAEAGSNSLNLTRWLHYAGLQKKNLQRKAKFIDQEVYSNNLADLDLIWDGDGHNKNAALTIFRHFDNASVVKGLVGDTPKTTWLISYSQLERIHYLLVAGFDVFGNVTHQLNTRLYMDFLRMEGESDFLGLLPAKERRKVRDDWYRDAKPYVKEYVYGELTAEGNSVNISYKTDDPKKELLDKIKGKLENVLNRSYDLSNVVDIQTRKQLARLDRLSGKQVSMLPQLMFLKVENVGIFTLINNSSHKNITHMFDEAQEREPEKDSLSVVSGFIGAHPNMFYDINKTELTDFVNKMYALTDENSYRDLVSRYGIRRNDPRFWSLSDEFHKSLKQNVGVESGLFDYNRYENR